MARDLRGFIKLLEERGQLRRISAPVDPDLEIAEISNRMLQKGGPGLLFANVKGASFPVAVNLLGTVERICWAMNMQHPQELEELGKKLAMLQQPKPPKKISQAVEFGKVLFDVLKAKPGRDFFPACQDRKSTRLNSSHANISYAVFCLKKKKKSPINGSALY